MNTEDEHEDVDFESEDELGAAGALKAKIVKLREELEKAKKERQEYLDGWQRCKADSINARNDALAAGKRAGERAEEDLLGDIIPVIDSFDMASGSEAWESVDATWRGGIEQIRNQLLDVLSRRGVEQYGKVGDTFDPSVHEIVQETDDMPGETHSIVKILRFGYKKGARILRAAQVIVKK